MSVEDLLERTLNAGGFRVAQVGAPREHGDATLTDNQTLPTPPALEGAPGQSLLAAPSDHVHPLPLVARIAASGTTLLPPQSTMSLADFESTPGELFLPSGLVWVDDDLPIAWSGGVGAVVHPPLAPAGPPLPNTWPFIATWHKRKQQANAVSFMASNHSPDPVRLTWASVAYLLAPVS